MKYPCSILIFAAAATTAHAGLDSIEVIFAITGDLGYGDTTMSAQFDAISYEDGDAIFLEFVRRTRAQRGEPVEGWPRGG